MRGPEPIDNTHLADLPKGRLRRLMPEVKDVGFSKKHIPLEEIRRLKSKLLRAFEKKGFKTNRGQTI